MSEYVLTGALFFHRDLHRYATAQTTSSWSPSRAKATKKRSIGVLGLGELGGAAARKLRDHGFDVSGWSRSRKSIEGVRSFVGDELKDFLGQAEILVNLLPLTEATIDILDTKTLSCLPAGACLINVGRGAHLNDEALLQLLDSGHIGGALLDTFNQEPLPTDHPYWLHPLVFVTPHIASFTDPASAADLVRENLHRARNQQALKHAVTRVQNS